MLAHYAWRICTMLALLLLACAHTPPTNHAALAASECAIECDSREFEGTYNATTNVCTCETPEVTLTRDPATYLSPCLAEDGPPPCYWDAATRGNGRGQSFILLHDD